MSSEGIVRLTPYGTGSCISWETTQLMENLAVTSSRAAEARDGIGTSCQRTTRFDQSGVQIKKQMFTKFNKNKIAGNTVFFHCTLVTLAAETEHRKY